MQFIKTIQNFAFQNNLWAKGTRIVVGISGGPDSVCLLRVLTFLAPKYDFELHVAHVNYGLRGQESDKDEELVRELAKKYNLQISVLKAVKSRKGNLENNLRAIRYDFFEQLRKKMGFDVIAVAHNQDDQAETVLMRIMRGSGLSGLSAIKAKNGNIVRPLLKTSRKEIMAYLRSNELKFRTDKSNKDLKFTRNSIRYKLLPYLEKNYNPAIKKTLSEWAFSVADDYQFIEQEAERFVLAICKNNRAHICMQEFLQLHGAIQRQVIRRIYKTLNNSEIDVESGQVEEMLKVIKSTKNKTQKATIRGLNILKNGDNIDIFCE